MSNRNKALDGSPLLDFAQDPIVIPGFDPSETPGTAAAGITATTMAPGGGQLTDVLYLTEQGDKTAINVDDIHQGQLGDCFLLSALGELALYDPAAISKMISVNANGTESVKLFESSTGAPAAIGATSYVSTTQVVTNSFSSLGVNNGPTQDVRGSDKEIWTQVIEKAYAQANGGYAAINQGGNPTVALQQLTGHAAQWQLTNFVTASSLASDVAAGDILVMDTPNASNLPFNLVGDHAYMFEGLVTSAGTTCVKLGNPWGTDQPGLIPVSQLHSGIVEIDVGHV